MTEEEWLTCDDPRPFWYFFQGYPPKRTRKYILHACACLRLVWGRLVDIRYRQAVEIAERHADSQCKLKERHRAHINATDVPRGEFGTPEYELGFLVARIVQKDMDASWFLSFAQLISNATDSLITKQALALVRDIFGNPFRPVSFSPDWHSTDAVAIARTMYESRDFGAMPILADALQDAGCENEDILSHCRDTRQTHVRGCWVVDLVLGKE
jgi:hypothetical protein